MSATLRRCWLRHYAAWLQAAGCCHCYTVIAAAESLAIRHWYISWLRANSHYVE